MTELDQVEQLKLCSDASFRELYEIYAASIAAREQKPEEWICALVQSPNYMVWVVKRARHVTGFSILFLPSHGRFALLEYMAVAPEARDRGVGSQLFKHTMQRAMTSQGLHVPVVLEVDSDREECGDQQMRTRRQHFYRRLGCVRIAGLHYILPLSGQGPAPEMDLMVYSAKPIPQLPRAELEGWLKAIYQDVYRCSPSDPRIAQMMQSVSDPVRLE